MEKKEIFENQPIVKSLFKLGLPLILSQILNVLYNIVDRIFIGNLKDVGKDALAGVGITFPIILIISAFASLVGIGGAPLAGIKLGEKKPEEAQEVMMHSFLMCLITGVILTAVVLIFGKDLLFLFGITEELLPYGLRYLRIYALGSIFVMISLGLSAYISTQGFTIVAAITVLVGAIMNIVLDAVFIHGFNMGVEGVAIASVISQFCSALLIFIFLRSKKSGLKLTFKGFKFKNKLNLKILSIGVSQFTMQATEALIHIIINAQIVRYGGANYVAYLNIMAIMLSLIQLIVLPVYGLSQGASPLISYNFGAGNFKRVKQAYRALAVMSVTYTVVFYIIILSIPSQIASIFNQDPQVLEMAPRIMRIFFMGMSLFGIQLATQTIFMALGQSLLALLMALLRKVILLIPLAYILPLFMGIDGLFFAEMIADFTAAIVTFTTYQFTKGRIFRKRQEQIDMANGLVDKVA
ncbi:MAG: MATE family efflux transporter [Bacilli bacterium]|jgi:putative MATE family efflux protein